MTGGNRWVGERGGMKEKGLLEGRGGERREARRDEE